MALLMKQYRYFGENSSDFSIGTETVTVDKITTNQHYLNHFLSNTPDTKRSTLISGEFLNISGPIIQLGIQTLPGTSFFLNQNMESIIVGMSGIYELDLTDSSGTIDKIQFDMKSIDNIANNPDGYLIIDIVYEGE